MKIMGTSPVLLSCYGMISIKERKSNERKLNNSTYFFNIGITFDLPAEFINCK